VIRKSSFSQRSLEISQAPLFSVSGQPISCNELYYKQLGGRKTTTRCNTLFALFPIASSASHGEPVTFLYPAGTLEKLISFRKNQLIASGPDFFPLFTCGTPWTRWPSKATKTFFLFTTTWLAGSGINYHFCNPLTQRCCPFSDPKHQPSLGPTSTFT